MIQKALCRVARATTCHSLRHAQPPVFSFSLSLRSTHSDSTATVIRKINIKPPIVRSEILGAARQVTIETPDPQATTQEEVLTALATAFHTRLVWERGRSRRPGVIILATPSFATWLEDNVEFIPNFLKTITETKYWKASGILEIDVVCACVDGLSPIASSLPLVRGKAPVEGLSIRHGALSKHLFPSLFVKEEADPTNSSGRPSSITFSMLGRGKMDVTVPLANTLFKTGKHSTLLATRWRRSGKSFTRIQGPIEKRDIAVNIFGEAEEKVPEIHVPAIPLTPPHRIESGMGNIIRRIDFGPKGVGPASNELEDSVSAFLTAKNRTMETVSVWALIVPKDAPPGALIHNKGLIEWRWGRSRLKDKYIGKWVRKGATFCRVLSGGGGWGAKQGLLSLDPKTTYNDSEETGFDFSGGSWGKQQASALGSIAEPGALIQFFASESSKTPATIPSAGTYSNLDLKTTVFGTVPSTIDDIQQLPAENKEAKGRSFVRRGHFGCATESGIFLRHVPLKEPQDGIDADSSPATTKIDLPYSYIYRDLFVGPDGFRSISLTESDLTMRFEGEEVSEVEKLEEEEFAKAERPANS